MRRQEATDEREAFRALFEAEKQPLFRFLYRLTGHRQDAEDLLQETFARYWSKRSQFRGEGCVQGYLKRIAYRSFLNARTRLHRGRATAPLQHEPEDDGVGPRDRILLEDERNRVRAAIDELPDSWREAFLLFRFEGMRLREIAELLGATPKAIELRVARALQRVSLRLQELTTGHGEAR